MVFVLLYAIKDISVVLVFLYNLFTQMHCVCLTIMALFHDKWMAVEHWENNEYHNEYHNLT